jgi:NAD(P)-dependent dehydrogenase (short-subunit alcohol dehydrogenase family)
MSDAPVVLFTNPDHFAGPASIPALEEAGMRVVGFAAGDADEVAARVDEIIGNFGRIDVLINNDAHPAIRAPIETAELDDMRAGLDAMLLAPFAMARAVVPSMKANGGGKILFITSATPFNGLPNYSMYVAARGGANSLALTLAKELAGANIQVNAIGPNYVENPDYFPEELISNPETLARITKHIPLGRLGKPEELAALVVFLASDKANWITAQVFPFAGGWA